MTSFSVNGKQYIAVVAGWGQDAGGEVNTARPLVLETGFLPCPTAGRSWVFAL